MAYDDSLSIYEMMDDYANDNGIHVDDIFKSDKPKQNKPVNPPELQTPKPESMGVVYDIDEYKPDGYEEKIVNQLDEEAVDHANETFTEFDIAAMHINQAKKELGIELNMPPIHRAKLMTLAADRNDRRSIDNIKSFIQTLSEADPDIIILPINSNNSIPFQPTISNPVPVLTDKPADEVTIIVDKSDVNKIAFDTEDVSKIKKANTVILELVENMQLDYTIIEDDNVDINSVLGEYIRKMNDIPGPLPASMYRATFTGLTYLEIVNLSYSNDLNTLDGLRKKWQIAYEHTKNASIGPFNNLEDFRSKTSFVDLNYILCMILCATSRDRETVTVTCHHNKCEHSYEQPYNPKELMNGFSDDVLRDMQITADASDKESVMNIYKNSLINVNNTVKFKSGIVLCFGHVSAEEYITTRAGYINEVEQLKLSIDMALRRGESINVVDPELDSKIFKAAILPIIRYFLIPDKIDPTKYRKYSKTSDILQILDTLDLVDSKTILAIADMIYMPYIPKFTIRNVICPKCGYKSNVEINVADLLFTVAQSMDKTEIKFNRS